MGANFEGALRGAYIDEHGEELREAAPMEDATDEEAPPPADAVESLRGIAVIESGVFISDDDDDDNGGSGGICSYEGRDDGLGGGEGL